MRKMKVWRSFSEVKNAGYFVWDIMECEGVTPKDVERHSGFYMPTLDEGYILSPYCYHFWDESAANDFFYAIGEQSDPYNYQKYIQVGNGPVPF